MGILHPGEQTVELRFREIATRIDIARSHPDRGVRRQAQGVVANDAADLLLAATSLMARVAELEQQLLTVMTEARDGMTLWLADLAKQGGEVRFDKPWFEAFAPSGGWDVETTDSEIIVRARTNEELKALSETAQAVEQTEDADGPSPG